MATLTFLLKSHPVERTPKANNFLSEFLHSAVQLEDVHIYRTKALKKLPNYLHSFQMLYLDFYTHFSVSYYKIALR